MANNRVTKAQYEALAARGLVPAKGRSGRAPAPLAGQSLAVEFTVPYRPYSEANLRDWRARSRRSLQARHAVFATVRSLGAFNLRESIRPPYLVTLTRVGGRKWDGDNNVSGLKGVTDAVAEWLRVDDGDEAAVRWEYAQRPGPGPVGVVVRIESRGGADDRDA